MIGANAAMLVVLGLAATRQPPDLQVEAITAAGADLPELAEAVARALVVGGARVVLRGPTSGPCEYCGKVKVTEIRPGICEVEIRHEQHIASTTLRLPVTSSLLDWARAIAIQARLLVPWQKAPESKGKDNATELAARPVRRPEKRGKRDGVAPAQHPPSTTTGDKPSVALVPIDGPLPARRENPSRDWEPSPAEVERPDRMAIASPTLGRQAPTASEASRSDSKPVSRPDARKPQERAALAPPRGQTGSSPAADLGAERSVEPKHRWSWIPTAIGTGAAAAAGVCALVALGHYNAISDRNQSYDSAQAHKSAGENWQTASWVFSGMAAVGLATGIVGFSMRSSGGSAVTTMASPVRGGGLVTVAGNFR
jgi:hypothetical protein